MADTEPKAKKGILAFLGKDAHVQQWERMAVWFGLFACMGFRFHAEDFGTLAAILFPVFWRW